MRRKRGIQVAAVIMGVLLLAAGTVPVQAKTVSELEQEKQELEKKKQAAAELLAETKLQAAEKLEDILKENVQEMMEETAVKQNGEKTDKPEDGSDKNNSKNEDSVKEDRNA